MISMLVYLWMCHYYGNMSMIGYTIPNDGHCITTLYIYLPDEQPSVAYHLYPNIHHIPHIYPIYPNIPQLWLI